MPAKTGIPAYRIIQRQPATYLDSSATPVAGYRVRFEVPKVAEIHEINVASLEAEPLDTAIRKLVAEIEATLELGQ